MNLINNQAYLLIKALSYNLLNWFWLALFTEEDSHFEVSTIRRKILNVPGNLVGSRTYRHLKLAPNQELEARVNYMEKQLQIFLVWYIATMEEWSPELAAEEVLPKPRKQILHRRTAKDNCTRCCLGHYFYEEKKAF